MEASVGFPGLDRESAVVNRGYCLAEPKPHAGRVAIVTGAGAGQGGAGGIGRGVALRLADDGANVLVADVDAGAEATATLVRQAGTDSLAFMGDLSDEATVAAMVTAAIERWGRIDILVNNAGGGGIRPFLEHTADTLRNTIARNLWTTIWCCHKALPHMVAAKYGRIINMGADSVRNGLDNHAAYNAAKGGVHALTTGLAREYARLDITVNTVAPTTVETPWVKAMIRGGMSKGDYVSDPDGNIEKYFRIIPKGRGAEVSEVASLVSYLALAEAGFITGQVVSINGGSTML
jgi:2,3-dihydroxy-2,3-dihydro-p-cumate dehydrogenase